MDKHVIVPLVLFLGVTFAVAYVIQLLVHARIRIKTLQTCDSKELVESIVQGEDHRRRMASLRWGLVLVLEALAFGIIQWLGWTTITPGVVAVLIGAFGLASLIFFALARRMG
ncbi:hypothetical protein ISP15_08860 [Dyella jejuensis]|uniref:Transmembrane protein n=1 Tax=Dyella jejuensis TaxID=1432009 RepID=A0ABW8JJ05_9GAMM